MSVLLLCRAGVYLPPFSLHISFVFGGSKPPPYKVAVGKTCFMEDIPSPPCCYLPFFLLPYAEHPPQDGSNDGGGAQDDDLHEDTFLSIYVGLFRRGGAGTASICRFSRAGENIRKIRRGQLTQVPFCGIL